MDTTISEMIENQHLHHHQSQQHHHSIHHSMHLQSNHLDEPLVVETEAIIHHSQSALSSTSSISSRSSQNLESPNNHNNHNQTSNNLLQHSLSQGQLVNNSSHGVVMIGQLLQHHHDGNGGDLDSGDLSPLNSPSGLDSLPHQHQSQHNDQRSRIIHSSSSDVVNNQQIQQQIHYENRNHSHRQLHQQSNSALIKEESQHHITNDVIVGSINNSNSQHNSDDMSVEEANQNNKQEVLSVIVQNQEDSRDSQLLSPGKLTPTSEVIDTSDFRNMQEPTYQTLTSVNGRMSPPGFSPNSSYATLTPLQPLPPISTMSDKFAYGHGNSSSFTVMQNNGMGINLGGMGVQSPYNYDKLPSMSISPPHSYSPPTNSLGAIGQPSPLSPQSSYSQNGLQSPAKSMSPSGYDSPYHHHRDLLGGNNGGGGGRQTPNLSPQSVSLHSPTGASFGSGINLSELSTSGPTSNCTNTIIVNTTTGIIQQHQQSMSPIPSQTTPPGLVQISHHINRDHLQNDSPSPPLLTIQQNSSTGHQHLLTTVGSQKMNVNVNHNNNGEMGGGASTMINGNKQNFGQNNSGNCVNVGGSMSVSPMQNDVEEINTKELAQRISAELKRYSIPQAIFAQRVLCRSQGTLSDLLRNPKPWSKLKSGRETFRRMFKWLQEPEYQRMSALRLAGKPKH
jgi:one cut domain, family member 1 (hepatocyte nuclear factor 6)